jgi:hypothetical protein
MTHFHDEPTTTAGDPFWHHSGAAENRIDLELAQYKLRRAQEQARYDRKLFWSLYIATLLGLAVLLWWRW